MSKQALHELRCVAITQVKNALKDVYASSSNSFMLHDTIIIIIIKFVLNQQCLMINAVKEAKS